MKFLRARPFLSLAVATVLLGALWHGGLAEAAGGQPLLRGAVTAIGTPFIMAMRVSSRLFGHSAATPLVGLLLGIAPYLAADWVLRGVRARRHIAEVQ